MFNMKNEVFFELMETFTKNTDAAQLTNDYSINGVKGTDPNTIEYFAAMIRQGIYNDGAVGSPSSYMTADEMNLITQMIQIKQLDTIIRLLKGDIKE